MSIDEILCRFAKPRKSSRGFLVRCPAHGDRGPSLSIKEADDDGRILVHCFAGCSAFEIVEAMGLRMTDLFNDRGSAEERERSREQARRARAKRIELEEIEGRRAVLFRKAERVLSAASGIDISGWSPGRLEEALSSVAAANEILWREELGKESGENYVGSGA